MQTETGDTQRHKNKGETNKKNKHELPHQCGGGKKNIFFFFGIFFFFKKCGHLNFLFVKKNTRQPLDGKNGGMHNSFVKDTRGKKERRRGMLGSWIQSTIFVQEK